MKKKALITFGIFLFLIPFSLYFWLKSKVPNYSGETKLSGLLNKVEIRYDSFGVPRIFANNKKDLFFALGYAQARERLYQFQLMKRLIAGRISEVVGEKGLTVDKYFRSIGLVRNSKKYFERNKNKFSQDQLDLAYSYLNGVNAFIAEGETPADMQIMGLKPEKIEIEDTLAFVAFMGLGFGEGVHSDPVVTSLELEYGDMIKDITGDVTNYTLLAQSEWQNSKKFAELFGEVLYSMDESLDALNVPLFQGSNSWVISGRKTRSGKPILSNDPHIGFSNPSIWFEAYLEAPDFQIYGHFLPLIPIPVIGANSHHAWGLTMFENDDMDFYKETPVKGKEETHYLFQGKEYPYEMIEEEIQVKGGSPIKFQIKSTIHGPILNGLLKSTEELNFPVALRWTMFEDSNEYLKAFVGFMESKSLKEFEEASYYLKTPGLNIVYADRDGNIAYFACGALYEKNFPTDRILDGASGRFEWGREIPVTQRPRTINPSQGYIFTANHKHFGNLPYRLEGYWQADDRTERLTKLFKSQNTFDKSDVMRIILDDYFASADFYLPVLFEVLEKNQHNLIPIEKRAFEFLQGWDRKGSKESVGASLFSEFRMQLARKIFLDEFGERRYKSIAGTARIHHFMKKVFSNPQSKWWDNIQTPKKETREEIILDSFRASVAVLMGRLGTNPTEWKWEKLHTLTLKHALGEVPPLHLVFNSGPRGVGGGTEVINNLLTKFSENNHSINAGPSMRMIVDYADLEHVKLINPLGQSGHRFSPHFQDQADMYVNGEFRNVNFLDMKKDVNRVLVLHPQN